MQAVPQFYQRAPMWPWQMQPVSMAGQQGPPTSVAQSAAAARAQSMDTKPFKMRWLWHQSMCLGIDDQVKGKGKAVEVNNMHLEECQEPTPEHQRFDYIESSYQIRPHYKAGAFCLDSDGSNLVFDKCNVTKHSQRFLYDPATDHIRCVDGAKKPRCLHIDAGSARLGDLYVNGTNVIITQCQDDESDQKFQPVYLNDVSRLAIPLGFFNKIAFPPLDGANTTANVSSNVTIASNGTNATATATTGANVTATTGATAAANTTAAALTESLSSSSSGAAKHRKNLSGEGRATGLMQSSSSGTSSDGFAPDATPFSTNKSVDELLRDFTLNSNGDDGSALASLETSGVMGLDAGDAAADAAASFTVAPELDFSLDDSKRDQGSATSTTTDLPDLDLALYGAGVGPDDVSSQHSDSMPSEDAGGALLESATNGHATSGSNDHSSLDQLLGDLDETVSTDGISSEGGSLLETRSLSVGSLGSTGLNTSLMRRADATATLIQRH